MRYEARRLPRFVPGTDVSTAIYVPGTDFTHVPGPTCLAPNIGNAIAGTTQLYGFPVSCLAPIPPGTDSAISAPCLYVPGTDRLPSGTTTDRTKFRCLYVRGTGLSTGLYVPGTDRFTSGTTTDRT